MKLHNEIVVNAPAERAWQVLGEEFGAIAAWSATLRSSELDGELGVGAVRTCEGAGFGPFPPGYVAEELVHFDRARKELTYVARTGLPRFVAHAQNSWSIIPDGDARCRVRSVARLELTWWSRPLTFLLPRLLRADFDKFSEELRHVIERGTVHPRKLACAS